MLRFYVRYLSCLLCFRQNLPCHYKRRKFIICHRDSSVNIVSSLRSGRSGICFDSRHKDKWCISHPVRSNCCPPILILPGWRGWSGRGSKLFNPLRLVPKLNEKWSYTSIVPCVFMKWTWIILAVSKPAPARRLRSCSTEKEQRLFCRTMDCVEIFFFFRNWEVLIFCYSCIFRVEYTISAWRSGKKASTFSLFTQKLGDRGGAVGWGTALQVRRSWVRFPMVPLEFFIDIILPAALWLWGRLSL